MRALQSAWAQLTAKPSRIVATIVTIIIGIGFTCAALVFTSSFRADLGARIGIEYSAADVVITNYSDRPASEIAAEIAAIPDVSAADPLQATNLEFSSADAHNYLRLYGLPDTPALRWAPLVSGTWPAKASEIVVSEDTATAANLPLGASLTIYRIAGGQDQAAAELHATVVGIADTSAAQLIGSTLVGFVSPEALSDLSIDNAPTIAVIAAPGVDAGALAAQVQTVLGPDVQVRTAAEQAQQDVAAFTGQTTALTTVLLGFAAIALIVAGIVIVTTFTILLAGRRRQIALLRVVGATGGQVRRETLVEAGVIGAVGSVLGAALGIGVGTAAARIADLDAGGVPIPWALVAAVTVLGVLLTVGAAVIPASRAMRVPPLAALRPVLSAEEARRSGRGRLTVGIALALTGGAFLAAGVYGGSLLLALPGGALSAVGVLLLTRSFLPPLLRGVGGIARAAGVPGTLAAANAVRNPGRAAATSAALVVGVGLIVMLQVAAASVGASMDKAAADRYPVDISLTGDGSAIAGDVVSDVRAIPELSQVAAVPGAAATVTHPDGSQIIDMGEPALAGTPVTVLGVPADADGLVRGGLDALSAGTAEAPAALVPAWWLNSGVELGSTIVVTIDGHSQRFSVAVGRLSDVASGGMPVIVTESALQKLSSHTAPVALWGALGDQDDAATVMSRLNTITAQHPDLYVTGAAADRASLQSVLATVTTVATGLLAVAVVIAIVGIGNTIGLSVLERARESALVRALGLRRGQLRWTLALEGMLLALVGAVVGVLLGLIYGAAGAASTFREIGRDLVFSVPWGLVGIVLVVAVAAGGIASVLPARRAARTPPVAALAEE